MGLVSTWPRRTSTAHSACQAVVAQRPGPATPMQEEPLSVQQQCERVTMSWQRGVSSHPGLPYRIPRPCARGRGSHVRGRSRARRSHYRMSVPMLPMEVLDHEVRVIEHRSCENFLRDSRLVRDAKYWHFPYERLQAEDVRAARLGRKSWNLAFPSPTYLSGPPEPPQKFCERPVLSGTSSKRSGGSDAA